MHNASRSRFWSLVEGAPFVECDQIVAPTLRDAVRAAVATTHPALALRRNREVVDVYGCFRRFAYRGRYYIVKIRAESSAAEERSNAVRVRHRVKDALKQGFHIAIPRSVPLGDGTVGLVLPDYGRSLYEDPSQVSSRFPKEDMMELMDGLLRVGVEWQGCLPRNMIPSKHGFILIDWEDVIFHPGRCQTLEDDLTLMLWTLGWSQVYGNPDGLRVQFEVSLEVQTPALTSVLDRFEQTAARYLHRDCSIQTMRSICNDVTLQSEGYMSEPATGQFTPADLGHLIDDIVPSDVAVMYTFGTARLRQEKGNRFYGLFCSTIEQVLVLSFRAAGAGSSILFKIDNARRSLLLLLVAMLEVMDHEFYRRLRSASTLDEALAVAGQSSSFAAACLGFDGLSGHHGRSASEQRAGHADQILLVLFDVARWCFSVTEPLELIVRGSLGNRLVTCRSDLDFEVSGPAYPNGHLPVEQLLGEFLTVLGIDWEGSRGRPSEADLVAGSLTRDLHEWSELRKPGSHLHDPGWIHESFRNVSEVWWIRRSLYEQQETPLTSKLLFFEIRALITRLAFSNRLTFACTNCQLQHLITPLGSTVVNQLGDVLDTTLSYYEHGFSSEVGLLALRDQLDQLRLVLRNPG